MLIQLTQGDKTIRSQMLFSDFIPMSTGTYFSQWAVLSPFLLRAILLLAISSFFLFSLGYWGSLNELKCKFLYFRHFDEIDDWWYCHAINACMSALVSSSINMCLSGIFRWERKDIYIYAHTLIQRDKRHKATNWGMLSDVQWRPYALDFLTLGDQAWGLTWNSLSTDLRLYLGDKDLEMMYPKPRNTKFGCKWIRSQTHIRDVDEKIPKRDASFLPR